MVSYGFDSSERKFQIIWRNIKIYSAAGIISIAGIECFLTETCILRDRAAFGRTTETMCENCKFTKLHVKCLSAKSI